MAMARICPGPNMWDQHFVGIDTNKVWFEVWEDIVVQHSFAAAHSGGVFEEDCTYDFGSLPSVIWKVEYLFDHYQSLLSGYEYQGPHLSYSEVHVIVASCH